jgi:signal transduction histidine kinase
VLWAVLDNAVKYSPPRSAITVRVSATTESGEAPGGSDGHGLEIAVVDRGRGMTAAVREHAFDQFFRADEARRAAPDGSGIGLYAARGLMEAMGGSITIDGSDDEGTVVRVQLPAEPISADEG